MLALPGTGLSHPVPVPHTLHPIPSIAAQSEFSRLRERSGTHRASHNRRPVLPHHTTALATCLVVTLKRFQTLIKAISMTGACRYRWICSMARSHFNLCQLAPAQRLLCAPMVAFPMGVHTALLNSGGADCSGLIHVKLTQDLPRASKTRCATSRNWK